jgi:hypothetical protein
MTSEVAYVVRALRRQPAFAAGVVLTFALAIGVNATMFGLVSKLMLAPPAGVRDAEQVARVALRYLTDDGNEFVASTTSYPKFRALHGVTGAFSAVAASKADTLVAGQGTAVSRVPVLGVTGDYIRLLGSIPMLGRAIERADDEPPAGQRVVVVSHAYWRMAFGGDAGIIGRDILLNDKPFKVVGVAPPGFNGDSPSAVALFMPLSALMADRGAGWLSNHHMNVVSIVVRLRDGVLPLAASAMARGALVEEATSAGDADAPSRERVSGGPERASGK